MNRKSHPILTLLVPAGALVLLLLLLTTVTAMQPAANAAGSTIKVPDEYATIQEAIDAATGGDTIQVAEGTYAENLSIEKAITLSGGWNISFTEQSYGMSVVDGEGLGRAISITTPLSDSVVTIIGFTIEDGNATGLGGVPASAHDGLQLPDRFTTTVSAASMGSVDVAYQSQMLASRAEAILNGDFCKDDSSGCQAMLQMVIDRLNALESAQIPDLSAADVQSDPEVDCGGAIYSHNANLRIYDSIVQDSIASLDSDGSGGGVCIWQSPSGGSVIARTTFENNMASVTSLKDGFGGGLYALEAPGIVIEGNTFHLNTAANAGLISSGIGGGLMIWESPGAIVAGNQVERNIANAGTLAQHGLGGGVYVGQSNGITVTNNTMKNNIAVVNGTCAGGGLMVNGLSNATIAENEITDNWSCAFAMDKAGAGGGGAALYGLEFITVTGNSFQNNTAAVTGAHIGFTVGGGLDGENWLDTAAVFSNTFENNLVTGEGEGRGGGVSLWGTINVEITGNDFIGNRCSTTAGEGYGGGLYLLNNVTTKVLNNLFQANIAADGDYGAGGGMEVVEQGPQSFGLTVDSNIFVDNQANTNPDEMYDGSACLIGMQDIVFTNNIVASSEMGSAVYLPSARNMTLVNNTFVNHKGSAITLDEWNTTPVTLTNNIIVSSTIGISVATGVTAIMDYTLWDGNGQDTEGGGTINNTHPVTGSPAFRDSTNNDYHLTITSAAINAGDPAGVPPAPDHDLDGVVRPQGEYVDIGAYELVGSWLLLPQAFTAPDPPVDKSGWAVGVGPDPDTGAIVHTDNGGKSWETQGVWDGIDATDISAVDDQTAWAAFTAGEAKAGGAIMKTTDGGTTWVSQTMPITIPLGIKGIKALSQDEAWAASLDGIVLHTTDGGDNWVVVPHDSSPITQVNRMDAMGDNVWIADSSDTGAVVHTANDGVSWRREFLPNGDSPLTVHAFSPTIVWGSGQALADNPTFYRTLDGGDEWKVVQNVGQLDHLDDVCAAGENYAWGVVNGDAIDGHIFRVSPSSTGEPVAVDVTPPELKGLSPGGVSCLNTEVAWVVAFRSLFDNPDDTRGLIFYTDDGGESWAIQNAPTNIQYWKVSFVDALR